MRRTYRQRACLAGAGLAATVAACTGGTENPAPAPSAQAGTSAAGMPAGAAGAGTGGASAGTAGAGAGSSGLTGGAGASAGTSGAGMAGNGAAAGNGPAGSAGMSGAGGLAGAGGAGAAGMAGAAGGAGIGTGTLTLTGFMVEPNPNMTISCFVSWTTAEPATSEVEFGEGGYQFRIRHPELVTEHRVLVIGMHAQQAYQIKAVSSNTQGTGSAEGMFMTGMLPSGVPTTTLSVGQFAQSHVGWTLTNIQPQSGPARIVMYDQEGVPVWYYVHGSANDSRGDVSADLLDDGVLVGPTSGEPARLVDLSGEVLWEGPPNSQAQLMTHFATRNSSGNYILNREMDKTAMNGNTRIDDQRLEEITPEREVLWSWNLFDHVPPSGTKEELCHANALQLDEAAGFFYYNCRWVGLMKIERASGDIVWRMGGTYDETSLGPGDFTFSPPASQFSDAHEPELHADGTLILYDNGGYAGLGGPGGGTYHSRVLEYQVDQTAMTATLIWEFPGNFSVDSWYTDDWYTPFWGDADPLPNDNVLITAGVRSNSASSRIFEVTRAGAVVWEVTFPPNNGIYRAERLAPPPLVEPIP